MNSPTVFKITSIVIIIAQLISIALCAQSIADGEHTALSSAAIAANLSVVCVSLHNLHNLYR